MKKEVSAISGVLISAQYMWPSFNKKHYSSWKSLQ